MPTEREALRALLSLVRREAPHLSGKVVGDAEAALASAPASEPVLEWCVHCGEGTTGFCRSKCENRSCPKGLPRPGQDSHPQAQRAAPIWDEDDRYTVERAAELLEGYVNFILSDVMEADIERHPYVPEIEGTAKDLRQLAEGSRPKPVYVTDEKSDIFFELAWKHGACGHTNFDGDDLASLTLTAEDFVQFCAGLQAMNAAGEKIFEKVYIGEDLPDMARDLHEAFIPRLNPAADIPTTDEHGIHRGHFTLSLTWAPEPNDAVQSQGGAHG